ncbi:ABC transporter permease [Cellulomonas sp. DKR-3]|uniref:ABC transporter permease n=1 Tax=Cellulomonas fulva TaxID=2835530 RepID=A0ABS5TXP4_9CELL|nr:ABC transporter permease subunit [Cellulomonas fulva]MBT0993929.1 ABC transporter permease [Cellulomonas fulva]
MSVVEQTGTAPTPAAPPRHARWGLTWHGVRTVAALELRQRVRSTRWLVALIVYFVVVGALTLLLFGALSTVLGLDDGGTEPRGPVLFAAVTFLVLGLGLLVTPTLTSAAVNGDRNAGTLATLQVTLLTPAEIALGKLLAAWVASCAFLVTSIPFLAFATAAGPTPWWSLLFVVLLIATLLIAVCGIGLGLSALVSRTAGSTVLTFVVVASLAFLSLILFGVTYPAVTTTETTRVYTVPSDWDGTYDGSVCTIEEQVRDVAHTERTWWLLAINPFVVVADGSGTSVAESESSVTEGDLLGYIRFAVRTVRDGPDDPLQECWVGDELSDETVTSTAPVWPWGLAANLLLGVAGFVVAVRRLSIPQRTLPRGTRVA